jgi:hypothetical protein
MVFLICSRRGYDQLLGLLGTPPSPLWIGDGVLTPGELQKLRDSGADVTNFAHPIDPTKHDDISSAVETICEHHPGQIVWVEMKSN